VCKQNLVFRCCLLTDDEWLVIDYEKERLLHITKDGKLKATIKYDPNPYRANLFANMLVVSTIDGLNFHKLWFQKTKVVFYYSLFILLFALTYHGNFNKHDFHITKEVFEQERLIIILSILSVLRLIKCHKTMKLSLLLCNRTSVAELVFL